MALDTSTSKGSLALISTNDDLTKGSLVYHHKWWRKKSHSEYLTPAIESALGETHWSFNSFDGFFITHGPGSFTGLRVSMNTVKAFSYTTGKPIYSMSVLKNLALATFKNEKTKSEKAQGLPIVCLINAFKNLIYVGVFEWKEGQLKTTKKPEALDVKGLDRLIDRPHLCLGDGYKTYKSHFPVSLSKKLIRHEVFEDEPDAQNFIFDIPNGELKNRPETWKDACPFYVRPSSAEEKRQKIIC